MKIFLVAGARPNFMKVAPIIRAIKRHNRLINKVLVHTGQHYDYEMSKVFFEDLELPEPDIYLGAGSGSHAEQTGQIMIKFEEVLLEGKPDLVVVVGDVNSTIACALASVKLHIPVAHVEAGLRSFDRTMPEEINRLLTDAISDYLFTPSPDADENLKNEGIPDSKIFLVGDIMVDSLLFNLEKAKKSKILERLGLRKSLSDGGSLTTDYSLLTLHRPSNVDDKDSFSKIIAALTEIAKRIPIIFPAHLRTKKQIETFGLRRHFNDMGSGRRKKTVNKGIYLLEPLGYLDFLNLMMQAKFVLTDSGGIQEETTVLDIPCLTLRDTTERPITISQGTNVLVWNNTQKIINEAFKVLDGKGKQGKAYELWDGKTAPRIVDILVNSFQPAAR
ncbi:MAG: UDP-N-acetylglucosamine 2-epimerase (non-hydrolyzing) [Deltaproteobacteria bacterium]|nr:MAG: UDP-N-acetylglucosamine 2-epimerase (non-hydrolyzing) [Deltaproteobacteria bacterium]